MQCRLCGSPAEPFSLKGRGYAECPSCGYIQLDAALIPAPAAERERYLLHRNDPDDPGYRGWMEEYLDRAVLPWARRGGEALDFGSGPEPLMARLLESRGFRPTAYDPFFAPGDSWRGRHWDIVVLHEVAEHLAEPGAAFRELGALVKPDGLLCVRTRFPPADRRAFSGWWYRMDSTHVGFFPRRAILHLAGSLGFAEIYADGVDSVTLRRTVA